MDSTCSLPENVVLLTLQELEDGNVLLRLAHLYEKIDDHHMAPRHCHHQRRCLTTVVGNHPACDILFTTIVVTITTQTLPCHNKQLASAASSSKIRQKSAWCPQPHPTEERVYHNPPLATTQDHHYHLKP
ncbi:hypothetical protein E3N88_16308 [Mikania micrantha]|uniref:Uncharacterized protein n=1 Tax=Mikania micrantha TaxID=192012 RepID=A0A5N6NZB7_9ASTR|nr:hypothetical protein E3N88_16308 [Mikania micrantha]